VQKQETSEELTKRTSSEHYPKIAVSLSSFLHSTTNSSFLKQILEDCFSQGEGRKGRKW